MLLVKDGRLGPWSRPGPESGCSQAQSPLICCKSQSPVAWEFGPEGRARARAPRASPSQPFSVPGTAAS
jgi:hypothetical protein